MQAHALPCILHRNTGHMQAHIGLHVGLYTGWPVHGHGYGPDADPSRWRAGGRGLTRAGAAYLACGAGLPYSRTPHTWARAKRVSLGASAECRSECAHVLRGCAHENPELMF